ncbi:MAG: DUF2911 domain-containing protein [bacterium]
MRLALLALVVPLPVSAQVRASESGSMSQTIDGTTISVEYSRPRARGRDTLFGKYDMKTGHIWTPGANYATTLDVSKDIKLNGAPVPKGKYSMWFVFDSPSEWTLLLDPRAHRYHEDRPDAAKIPIRIATHPEPAPFTEVLSWSMPAIRMDGGTLAMDWERKHVPLDIQVQPSLVTTLSASDAAPYLGEYMVTDVDSTGKVQRTYRMIVSHEDGTLKAVYDPIDPYFRTFALVRIAPDWFAPGVYDSHGVLYEVLKPEMTFEFSSTHGRASAFVMRGDDDAIYSRGVRKP